VPYDVDMGPIASEEGASEAAQTLFRSDLFGHLYELIRVFPGVTGLLQSVIRIEIVIDANVVLGEIRFRLKRRNPQARSDLGEAIESGIVIAIAPQYLTEEIDDDHLSRILDGTGKTVSDARREWNDFRTKIRRDQAEFNRGGPLPRHGPAWLGCICKGWQQNSRPDSH
jgi:hypothetical protein